MNCHYHDFVGPSPAHHHRGTVDNAAAMSQIVIAHDVNQPLTTVYPIHAVAAEPITNEQRQKRQQNGFMAKAAAVAQRYGGGRRGGHPAIQQQQRQAVAAVITAEVTRAAAPAAAASAPPPRRASAAAEPNFLALNGTFRKSSSSLLSAVDDLGMASNHSARSTHSTHSQAEDIPPPPPLKTEVTDKILSPAPPQQKQGSDAAPPLDSQVTEVVTNRRLKPPPRQQVQQRRVSDSVASQRSTISYRERPSFQAHDSITERRPMTKANRGTIQRPPMYPPVRPQQNILHNNSQSNDGGMLRGLAIEEQAQMPHRLQGRTSAAPSPATATAIRQAHEEQRALAVQEQEKLWREFSQNSHGSGIDTPNSSSALSPQQEQARLWDQIQQQRQQHNSSSSLNLSFSTGRASPMSPMEEQARLLETYQRKTHRSSPKRSAVEEQARRLQDFQPRQRTKTLNPIEEQAKRLREIQQATEQRTANRTCHRSNQPEEEVSLEMIMELSRREAEAQTQREKSLEQAVLQEALQRSREDLGMTPMERQLRQHDLELRQHIAELALQSSSSS